MGFLDRFKRDKPMTEAELNERSKVDGIKYRDLQVIAHMLDQGATLEAARHTLFYLYFPTEAVADAVAPNFRARGFEVRTPGPNAEYHAANPQAPVLWPVIAERHDKALVPDFLRDTVDLCEALAEANGGEYDGWEAGPDEGQRAAQKGAKG